MGGAAADFFGGAHGFEDAADNLGRAGTLDVVGGLGLEQLSVREDDSELVVQPMEEETQFWRLVHRSPRSEFLDAEPARHRA
jgi:hypothetical protein